MLGPVRGFTASEDSTQSPQTFGQSFIEASRASSTVPIAGIGGTTTSGWRKPISEDWQGNNSTANSHASQSHTSTHQALEPQQATLEQSVPLVDPTSASIQAPIPILVSTQGPSSDFAPLQASDDSARVENGTGNSPASVAQSFSDLTSQPRAGFNSSRAFVNKSDLDIQGLNQPQVEPAFSGPKAHAGTTGRPLQNTNQNAGPDESHFDLQSVMPKDPQTQDSKVLSTASSIPIASQIQSAVSVEGQIGVQNAATKVSVDTLSKDVSCAPSNAAQNTTHAGRQIQKQNDLSNEDPDMAFQTNPMTFPIQAPELAQGTPEYMVPTGPQSSASGLASGTVVGIVSASTPGRVANSIQDSSPEAVSDAISNPISILPSAFKPDSNEAVVSQQITNGTPSAASNPRQESELAAQGIDRKVLSSPISSSSSTPNLSNARSNEVRPNMNAFSSVVPDQRANSVTTPLPSPDREQQSSSITSSSSSSYFGVTGSKVGSGELRPSVNALSSVVPDQKANSVTTPLPSPAPGQQSSSITSGSSNSIFGVPGSKVTHEVISTSSNANSSAVPNNTDNAFPKPVWQILSDLFQSVSSRLVPKASSDSTNPSTVSTSSSPVPVTAPELTKSQSSTGDSRVTSSPAQSTTTNADAYKGLSSATSEDTASSSSSLLMSDQRVSSSSNPDPVLMSVKSPIAGASGASKGMLNGLISGVMNPMHVELPSVLPAHETNAAANLTTNTSPKQATTAVTNQTLVSTPNSILSPMIDAAHAPRLHMTPGAQLIAEASAKNATSTTTGHVTPDQPNPSQSLPAGNATVSGLSAPSATADQLLTIAKSSGGLFASSMKVGDIENPTLSTGPSAVTSSSGKSGAKEAINGIEGSTQPAPSTPGQADNTINSQNAISSNNQSQGSLSPQVQSATQSQIDIGNHTVIAAPHTQTGINTAPAQMPLTVAAAPALASKIPDHISSIAVAPPQASPVINTAKLIQSMGQTEMRVGMRSTEFGNISISTSTNRETISAQISLDHGELAKTLTAGLPEMQARLGSNQAVDVRIGMNGAASSAGMSDGSAGQSQSGRQQPGDSSSSHSSYGVPERQFSSVPAAVAIADARSVTRLDIRV